MITRFLMTTATVALLAATPALAADDAVQDTLEAHEQRMDRMDTKLDAILDLLTKQASGGDAGATDTAPGATAASAPAPATDTAISTGGALTADDLAPGLLYELFVIPGRDLSASIDYPAGYSVDEAPPKFVYARFMDESELATNASLTGDFVLESRWSGFVRINEPGPHVFVINSSRDGNDGPTQCTYTFAVNEEVLSEIKSERFSPRHLRGQSEVNFEVGLYPFRISLKCATNNSSWRSKFILNANVIVDLKIKAPSMRAPEAPDSNTFVHVR